MTWIKIDDGFPDHPKVFTLSDLAFRIHIKALCYSGKYLTDGFIPMALANQFSGNKIKAIAELCSAGLWREKMTENGFQIHNYLEHQASKERVEEVKKLNRERANKRRNPNSNAVVRTDKSNNNAFITLPDTDTDTDTDIKIVEHLLHKDLATLLALRIFANGSKQPAVTLEWIKDIRLMMERDNRTYDEIHYIINWCQDDLFWRSNILSPSKLRKQFDQLVLKAKSENTRKVPQGEKFLRDYFQDTDTKEMRELQ